MNATTCPSSRASHCSPDVEAFARQRGIGEALPQLLEATEQIFAEAQRIEVYLEDDPELPDEWHVVMEVLVEGLTIEQAFGLRQEWNRALYRWLPYEHICCVRLAIDWVAP